MSQFVSQSLKFDCTYFRLPFASFVEMADRDIRALFFCVLFSLLLFHFCLMLMPLLANKR